MSPATAAKSIDVYRSLFAGTYEPHYDHVWLQQALKPTSQSSISLTSSEEGDLGCALHEPTAPIEVSLLSLPTDVLLEIASFLPRKSLASLIESCKSLWGLARAPELLALWAWKRRRGCPLPASATATPSASAAAAASPAVQGAATQAPARPYNPFRQQQPAQPPQQQLLPPAPAPAAPLPQQQQQQQQRCAALKRLLDGASSSAAVAASLRAAAGGGTAGHALWEDDVAPELTCWLVQWAAKAPAGAAILEWALCLKDKALQAALRSGSPAYQSALTSGLLAATAHGRAAVIKLLIEEAGADVHAEHDRALRWACIAGNAAIVALLLDYGADVHALGDFALQVASQHAHHEVMQLLMARGADLGRAMGPCTAEDV